MSQSIFIAGLTDVLQRLWKKPINILLCKVGRVLGVALRCYQLVYDVDVVILNHVIDVLSRDVWGVLRVLDWGEVWKFLNVRPQEWFINTIKLCLAIISISRVGLWNLDGVILTWLLLNSFHNFINVLSGHYRSLIGVWNCFLRFLF